jgi:hypothetical protein
MEIIPALNNEQAGVRTFFICVWVTLLTQWLLPITWFLRSYLLHPTSAQVVGWDFHEFWSVACRALGGELSQLPYPPTFLLAMIPAGLLSYPAAFALFSFLGIAAFVFMQASILRGMVRSHFLHFLPFAANPAMSIALLAGQNSLFTAAAAGGALALLDSNSVLAGACIAILAIKPQFGLLFPLALICGRYWKVFAWSALWTIAFSIVSAAVFGVDAWTTFASQLSRFNGSYVEQGTWIWTGTMTVFALCRLAGLSVTAAYVVHGFVAVPAVAAMAFLWIQRARFELRASALIIATMLVPPYIMFYEVAWLAIPTVFLVRDAKAKRLNGFEWRILFAAWLMPIQACFARWIHLIQWQMTPVVLIALLAMVVHRHFASEPETDRPESARGVKPVTGFTFWRKAR